MTASFDWESLSQAPAAPGVYAWYLDLALPQADLAAAEAAIVDAHRAGDKRAARRAARSLLETTISNYFSELPYDAQIWGPLKPAYRGRLEFQTNWDPSFLDALASDPTCLRTLRALLPRLAPAFVAPLYIGMSGNLQARLAQHKYHIGRDVQVGPRVESEFPEGWSEQERSFATEVRARAIPVHRLFVQVETAPETFPPRHIEYLLNRICYPVYGRR